MCISIFVLSYILYYITKIKNNIIYIDTNGVSFDRL